MKPLEDFGPLFQQPTRGTMGILQPRLRHSVDTCVAEERRQAKRIGERGRAIVAYLTAHGPHTRAEIAEGTGIRIQSVCSTVDALRKNGFVIQLERVRNGGHLLQADILERRSA